MLLLVALPTLKSLQKGHSYLFSAGESPASKVCFQQSCLTLILYCGHMGWMLKDCWLAVFMVKKWQKIYFLQVGIELGAVAIISRPEKWSLSFKHTSLHTFSWWIQRFIGSISVFEVIGMIWWDFQAVPCKHSIKIAPDHHDLPSFFECVGWAFTSTHRKHSPTNG